MEYPSKYDPVTWLPRLITIILISMIIISGLSSIYLYQTQDHNIIRDRTNWINDSISKINVSPEVSSHQVLLPLKHTQIKFILIEANSNVTPSGKFYINGELAMNVTGSNLSNLRFKVDENRFYRFQINFSNNTYLPYYLNTTIEGNTSVPVILQSTRDSATNVYMPKLELNNQFISLIVAFLLLMLFLVVIPKKYLGRN